MVSIAPQPLELKRFWKQANPNDKSPNLFKTRRDFEAHINAKIENSKWLGRLVEHALSSNYASIFPEFPYDWSIMKSKVQLVGYNPIIENKEEFGDTTKPTYVISMPCHNPNKEVICRVIKQIEDEAFGTTPEISHPNIGPRVALVMGLNTFESYDVVHNQQFVASIAKLRASTLSTHLSMTILPFFWKHQWVPKSNEEMIQRHVHPVQTCYRLAKSYFRQHHPNPNTLLLVSDKFNELGRPLTETIPFQQIRERILKHSTMKGYIEEAQAPSKYVVSLDGDFSSLRAPEGVLSQYDQILENHDFSPHVMSTGYLPPSDEANQMIVRGVDLDRRIRAAIPGGLVYMPEPNFAFLIEHPFQLTQLSWIGKGDRSMHTESRRLITNGIASKIFDESKIIFRNTGGVRTEIDEEWRTKTVKGYHQITPGDIYKNKFQNTLRGIHQSHADPQVCATNIYCGLGVTISQWTAEGVAPIKALLELFDPVAGKKIRFPLELSAKSSLTSTLDVFEKYLKSLNYYKTDKYGEKAIVKWFFDNTRISSETEKSEWEAFLMTQMDTLESKREVLLQNYTVEQFNQIFEVAQNRGRAIHQFYQELIATKVPTTNRHRAARL